MKTLAESINGLNKAVKENREKIDIHKLVVKKFPNSTIEVAQIEDGSQVFLCDGVKPNEAKNHRVYYDRVMKKVLIRPYIKIPRGKKPHIEVYTYQCFKLNLQQILEMLNAFVDNKKIVDLPEVTKTAFGSIFLSESEAKTDFLTSLAHEASLNI
jgi:hypothetical protein